EDSLQGKAEAKAAMVRSALAAQPAPERAPAGRWVARTSRLRRWVGAVRRPCRQDRADDAVMGAASAEVAVKRPAYVILGRVGLRCQQCGRRHENPGEAESALRGLLIEERLLKGTRFVRCTKRLNRNDGLVADRPHWHVT